MDFFNDFVPYVGLAVILYAIRQLDVPNKYIPLMAIVLSVPYAFWEQGINPESFIDGLQYALLAVGTVAGIKYFLEQQSRRG